MRKLDQHIAQAVFSGIFIVLAAIVSLDTIASLLSERHRLENQYDMLEAARYTLYTIPGSIYRYLSFASLVGALVGLGTLANQSELIIMRAAGISVSRIVWSVMKPMLILMLFGILLGEYAAPITEQIAQSRRSVLQQGGDAAIKSKNGLWSRSGDEYMHFNAVEPNGVLHGVTLYRFNAERQLQEASYATRASFQKDHWLVENVVLTVFNADGSAQRKELITRKWYTDLSPSLLKVVVLEARDLSITGLYQYANYLGDQGLNSGEYLLSFWKKVLQPLSTASLVLIAISFVFGPLREVTMGYRIFSGVMVGIVFQTTQDLLGPASLVFGFDPIYATGIPIAICAGIGIVLLRRTG